MPRRIHHRTLLSAALLSGWGLVGSAHSQVDVRIGPSDRSGDAETIAVPVQDLFLRPAAWHRQRVRTTGVLTPGPATTLGRPADVLREGLADITLSWDRELESTIEATRLRWLGRSIEVWGTFIHETDVPGVLERRLLVDGFSEAPENSPAAPDPAPSSPYDLIVARGSLDGQLVAVEGLFRGHNLFDDMPAGSARRASDWVLLDGCCSIWVRGKKPEGEGWALDPASRSDSRWRLRVVGRPETVDGVVYLDAVSVQRLSRDLE